MGGGLCLCLTLAVAVALTLALTLTLALALTSDLISGMGGGRCGAEICAQSKEL